MTGKAEQLDLAIAAEMQLTPQKWNEPIPLTDPTGQVVIYMCPQCDHVIANISGGGWESRRDDSYEQAKGHCCCYQCGVRIGSGDLQSLDSRLYCKVCRERQMRESALMRPMRETEIERRSKIYEVALLNARNDAIARALEDLMSDISEEYYCAGWLIGLEFTLWSMLEGGSREFGMGVVTEDEVKRLRELSEQCGGWWWGGETDDDVCRFVTLEEWAEIYGKGER